MISNNPDYQVQLYKVDEGTGEAIPTVYIDKPDEAKLAVNGVDEGIYLLNVTSNGALEDDFSLQVNATMPSGDF